MAETNSGLVEALNDMKIFTRHFDAQLQKINSVPYVDLFNHIINKIAEIDKPVTPQKPPNSEKYLQQWRQYLNKEIIEMDKQAIRYLCWESETVNDPEFYKYIHNHPVRITSGIIKALVATIHLNWHPSESPNRPIVKYTAKILREFTGKDRTIAKWYPAISMLLEKSGAAYFARDVLLTMRKDFKAVAELWALNENTAYMRYAAYNAFDQSLDKVGSNIDISKYILDILLGWNIWQTQPDGFRKIISRLILHPNINSVAEELRVKILAHPMLGDPRLPDNLHKWAGIDPAACQKFIGWLAKRDIVFFFDHILEGRDPHGRRDFWLNYVNSTKLIASRPFLSENAAYQVHGMNREILFGRLSAGTNKAAFILHFGDIVAVEFSDVGKVYIYLRHEFENQIEDIWTPFPIREHRFKCQDLPDNRMIRHVNWEYKVKSVLAKYGVRP